MNLSGRPTIRYEGSQQGFLKVLRELADVQKPSYKVRLFECLCVCDVLCVKKLSFLKNAPVVSCGCKRVKKKRNPTIKHGHARKGNPSPTYRVWVNMLTRCHNPNAVGFPDYGAKGIKVCKRWRASFENFLADMGVRPKGLSIDRIDCRKGYTLKNCRWATNLEQGRNKSNNKFTLETAQELRKLRAEGMSFPKLAAKYNTSISNVQRVAGYVTWKP